MCGEFERTFRSYEVKHLTWPELTPDELARVRGMPFWREALETELTATKRIRLMVEAESDRARCDRNAGIRGEPSCRTVREPDEALRNRAARPG